MLRNYITSLDSRSDDKFFEETRVTRASFNKIVNIVEEFVGPEPSFATLPYGAKYAVHAALHYLGNSSSYRCTGTTLGVPRSAACVMTARVIDALVYVAPEFIKWPTEHELAEVSEAFHRRSNISGIIGAVDGCHKGVVPPDNIQSDFINRKMQHSMNIMAIATDDLRFTYVSAGEYGRDHDSFVFKNTDLWKKVMGGQAAEYFPNEQVHLIGDSAFELHTHLLVPYAQPKTRELTRNEKLFNTSLSKSRACIENAFGYLKGRFRILKYKVDADLDKAAKIMLACCVLHNICMTDAVIQACRHRLIPKAPAIDERAFCSHPDAYELRAF